MRSRLARRPGSDFPNETTGNLRLRTAEEVLGNFFLTVTLQEIMICIFPQQGWLRRSRSARRPGSDIPKDTTGNLRFGKAQEELSSSCAWYFS